jgi:hypothetical protein
MGLKTSIIEFLKEANEPSSKGDKKSKPPTQKMILSKKFRDILHIILESGQSNVTKRLLELESDSSDKFFDYSYVDLDDKGNVTFLTTQRIERLKSENKPEEEFWTSRLRQSRELRRFIAQTLPTFSQGSIEKFDNKFKAIFKEDSAEVNFEIVEGEDIIYWYNYKNYETRDGSLGGSCMSGNEASKYLSCYALNPNQCKMIILKSNEDNEKIRGRAIIWKLTAPDDRIFMDRVYVNKNGEEHLFLNYAKKQGWMYKDEQKYGMTDLVYKGEKGVVKAHVVLENTDYDLYPYVDTLRIFYPEEKVMANYYAFKTEYRTLTDTEGHFDEWGDDEDDGDYDVPMVYDAYNDINIPEGRATWCNYDNAFCSSDDAVRLPYNGQYAFPNSSFIVTSKYNNKQYAKEDCVFSVPLDSWVWKKYAVDVYHDKEKTKKDKIHRFELNKTIGKIGDDYFDLDLLVAVDKKTVIDKDGKSKTETIYEFK